MRTRLPFAMNGRVRAESQPQITLEVLLEETGLLTSAPLVC